MFDSKDHILDLPTKSDKERKISPIMLIISLLVVTTGFVMQLMEKQGASLILVIGAGLTTIFCFLVFYKKRKKGITDLLILSSIITFIMGFMGKLLLWVYYPYFLLAGLIAFLAVGVLNFWQRRKKRSTDSIN